jgi:colanic acid/amylovoran biosynthesis protein
MNTTKQATYPPRFLLYGSGRVSNYGCEAIVRGTVALLRERWPDARIRYASFSLQDDTARLADCPVEVVRRIRWPWSIQHHPRTSAWSLVGRARQRYDLPWLPNVDRFDLIDDSDVVLSIGGDLYTPVSGSDAHPRALIEFGEATLSKGKKYVVWGASVGPFPEGQGSAGAIVLNHLRRASLITSREPRSTSYLRSKGLADIVAPCSDPAYSLSSSPIAERPLRNRIGINLSSLSLRALGGPSSITSSAEQQANTIAALMDDLGMDVTLIPHVWAPQLPKEDDYQYLKTVYHALPSRLRSCVTVVSKDMGFIGIKRVLRQCDVVIAARMHCAVNSISELVPTILVAYSSKAYGMAEYAYGHSNWVVPVERFTPEALLPVVRSILCARESLIDFLENRRSVFLSDARNGVDALVSTTAP